MVRCAYRAYAGKLINMIFMEKWYQPLLTCLPAWSLADRIAGALRFYQEDVGDFSVDDIDSRLLLLIGD